MTTGKRKTSWTYQDYCQLPEEQRYEIIDGELYMAPAPGSRHQFISRNLEFLLWSYVRENQLGQVADAPYDIILSNEDVVQPDIVFVSRERQHIISPRGCEGAPDLVVEILSPATRRHDLETKRDLYARYGVREYWLVDPESNNIEVLSLTSDHFTTAGVFSEGDYVTSSVVAGLSLPVAEVFAET